MIYIEDDFLTEEQFTALKNKVDSHYSPIEPRELFDNYDFKNEPDKYILPIARSGDWLDSCIPNAPQCIPALVAAGFEWFFFIRRGRGVGVCDPRITMRGLAPLSEAL